MTVCSETSVATQTSRKQVQNVTNNSRNSVIHRRPNHTFDFRNEAIFSTILLVINCSTETAMHMENLPNDIIGSRREQSTVKPKLHQPLNPRLVTSRNFRSLSGVYRRRIDTGRRQRVTRQYYFLIGGVPPKRTSD